nr:MAG TPA: hypothetical protein [Caudoviricetes sp.]
MLLLFTQGLTTNDGYRTEVQRLSILSFSLPPLYSW